MKPVKWTLKKRVKILQVFYILLMNGGNNMGKHYFTNEQVLELSSNKYVKKVSAKAITYTDDFKMHVLLELENGKSAKIIFNEAGFDIKALQERRIYSSCNRWKRQYKDGGFGRLRDTRRVSSGRPRKIEDTDEEEKAYLRAKSSFLKRN
jgi:hypothetical protein